MCGGIASDPQAVPLLIGLGVAELSVSVPTIPGIKAQIRTLDMTECKRLAQQLELESAAEVRALCPQLASERYFTTRRHPMKIFKDAFATLQKIGKSLMLPVSVLPVAGILLGVGSAS